MVKGTSSMALGGPPLVKAAVGEDIDEESLGGSKVHTRISGVADLEVKSDSACLQAVRDYLSFFPPNHSEPPPAKVYASPGCDGLEPLCEGELLPDTILDVLPDESRKPYDMRPLVKMIVDDGDLFEMKPKWAMNLITGFARIGGMPVGIVANNPKYLGGVLDVNSADKAARFVNICDSFGIPLVFLQDVPSLHKHTAGDLAHLPSPPARCSRLCHIQDPQVSLLAQYIQGSRLNARGQDNLVEDLTHGLGGFPGQGTIERHNSPVGRNRVSRESQPVGLRLVVVACQPAGVGVLDHGGRGLLEIRHRSPGGIGIQDVVE
jgi:hypothetical protein